MYRFTYDMYVCVRFCSCVCIYIHIADQGNNDALSVHPLRVRQLCVCVQIKMPHAPNKCWRSKCADMHTHPNAHTQAFSILLCAFWFRAAEITSCHFPSARSAVCNTREARVWSLGAPDDADSEFEKVNDTYMWNAAWSMFITSTSVGYGNI